MSENLTKQYENYAKYLPSLQQNYSRFAAGSNTDVQRNNYQIPNNFQVSHLDFLKKNSKLWHCGYALYSAGQFPTELIKTKDIIGQRAEGDSVILGDSGGFQLGTGKIRNSADQRHLDQFKNDPDMQFSQWQECGFTERALNWLDTYADYSMTLDMVLWAKFRPESQLHKLSIEQLIKLSVQNLEFFDTHRSRYGRHTKFLNVVQDVGVVDGVDTFELWYKAVKGFDFEGWSLVGGKTNLFPPVKKLRRLLDDKMLDKSEWIHILAKSPPLNSIVFSAAQKTLRRLLHTDITISYDSSSPHQSAGKQRAFALKPEFSKDINSWQFGQFKLSDDYRVATGQVASQFHFDTPLSKFFNMSDMFAHTTKNSDSFVDSFTEHLMVNHNIYTYHKAAIGACDLIYHPTKKDHSKVPDAMLEVADLVNEYLTTETPVTTEIKLVDALIRIGSTDETQ
jgi:hypothetical protein